MAPYNSPFQFEACLVLSGMQSHLQILLSRKDPCNYHFDLQVASDLQVSGIGQHLMLYCPKDHCSRQRVWVLSLAKK